MRRDIPGQQALFGGIEIRESKPRKKKFMGKCDFCKYTKEIVAASGMTMLCQECFDLHEQARKDGRAVRVDE